jgi:DeoD family purine-nucleoside phosphorylase
MTRQSSLDRPVETLATIHLHPTAPLAERVLLPGDPGRALRLAQSLLDAPRMFNHNRGLWGYTGNASDGQPLTIQSTGMGGPSAAIVIAELIQLGARRFVRTGTCGGLDPRLSLGDLVIPTEALSRDGVSAALAGGGPLAPDPMLCAAITDVAAGGAHGDTIHSGPVVSTDLFYDGPEGEEQEWLNAGALAVEMETATLLALSARRGVRAAALLLVSDRLSPSRVRIGTEALHAAEERMGGLAAAALISESI